MKLKNEQDAKSIEDVLQPGEPMKVALAADRVDNWLDPSGPELAAESLRLAGENAELLASLVPLCAADDPAMNLLLSAGCAPTAQQYCLDSALTSSAEPFTVTCSGQSDGEQLCFMMEENQRLKWQNATLWQTFYMTPHAVSTAAVAVGLPWFDSPTAADGFASEPCQSSPAADGFEDQDNEDEAASAEWTTVIVKNIPGFCDRSSFLHALDAHGFKGSYDFVYLRIALDKSNKPKPASFRYAFVNFIDHDNAQRFKELFQGLNAWDCEEAPGGCQVGWSRGIQGLEAHIERYRNSPVMYREVPEDCKPVIFRDGRRVQFPRPHSRGKGGPAMSNHSTNGA